MNQITSPKIPKPDADKGGTVASNPHFGSINTGSQGKDPAVLVTVPGFVEITTAEVKGSPHMVNKCYLISAADLLDVVLKRNKNYPPGKFVLIDVRDLSVGEVQNRIVGAVHWSTKDLVDGTARPDIALVKPDVLREYNKTGSAAKRAAQAPKGSYIVFYCAQGQNRSPLYAAAYYEYIKKANNLDQKVCVLAGGYTAYKALADKVNPSLGKGTEPYHA